MKLAERAGARVLGAYEWGLGDKSRKANAALTGLGATRRILVSDTMLAAYSDDEIEVVLAHELAHHVYGDIWKGLLFESGLMLAGFFVARGRWSSSARGSASRASPTWRDCHCSCSPPVPCRWSCCRSRTRCRARTSGAPIGSRSS